MKLIKHILASAKDKKPTINNSDILEFLKIKPDCKTIIIHYENFTFSLQYQKSRNGKTWYAKHKLHQDYMPTIGNPKFLNINQITILQ